jgi:hypothetical protein
MGRGVRALIFLLLLTGCGGKPGREGFENRTRHSTSVLWSLWRAAQRSVARQVDLNPLERELHGAAAKMLPGDSRALGVEPSGVLVAAEPDVSADVLLAATGIARQDPTGMIACPAACNVRYAAAYSRYRPGQVRYAASWEFRGDNFSLMVEYEFESQILYRLGYDVRWR